MDDIKLIPFTYSQKDRDFMEQQEKARQRIIEVFGISEHELGVGGWYASEMQSLKEKFYQMLLDEGWKL